MRKLLSITAIAFLITVSSVACSGSAQDLMPLAPSAAPSATISVEAGDAVDTWDTSGKDKDRPKGDDRDKGKGKDREDSTTSQTVEVEGAVGTVTGACPAKTFTVGQHSIVTNSQTTYDDGLCAELVPLARVEVRAVKQADGTLVATKVEFEDEDADDDANDVKVEGIVSGLSGTCPAISFTAGGKTVSTSATTVFHKTTCAAVQNLTRVHVRGTLQTNGSVLARRVELEDDDDDDEEEDDAEDGDGNPHHGVGPHHGTVSSFRGTCPVVTFNLKGLRISTTKDTTYVGTATCEMLRPNVQVVVTGTLGTEPRTFTATTIAITRTH